MQDAELHAEEFIHLIDLSHDSVLVAWGAFWFRRHSPEQRWEIVDDHDLFSVAGRRTCIGNSAEPFGESRVEVLDPDGKVAATASTSDRSWVWLTGLESDTDYRYRVLIDGGEWAKGERWDSVPTRRGGYDLEPAGNQYDLRFRTWPGPDVEAERTRFVAIGDYGVGVRSDSESSRRQRRVAEALQHLTEEADIRFVLSLGDNIYKGEQGQVDDESGGEDDDWYSSFFQPYRYVISRIPVFPAIGNHVRSGPDCSTGSASDAASSSSASTRRWTATIGSTIASSRCRTTSRGSRRPSAAGSHGGGSRSRTTRCSARDRPTRTTRR